jgi:uncharacterized caspase-like protein
MGKKIFIASTMILCVALWTTGVFAERALKMTREETYSEQRIALVIGNSDYKNSPLKNPVNDATDMAKKLESLGFKVKRLLNADQVEMKKAIRQFGVDLKKGGVGLFYYAGHGMQVKGNNYLIPVGVDIAEEDEVEDLAVDASLILRKMQSADNRLNIVLLDACRNNPFARSFRSAERGLAQMDAPAGTMISYATAPGMTAADGDGRNGVFTKNLLKALDKSGNVELSQLMKQVGKGVQEDTKKGQTPWVSSSVTGDFYFINVHIDKAKGDNTVVLVPTKQSTLDEDEEFWLAIKSSNKLEDFKDYVILYPEGRFRKIADIKIRQLSEEIKKPEPGRDRVSDYNPTTSDSTLLADAFNNNDNTWKLWPDGEFYITDIRSGTFVMETKNDLNSSEFMGRRVSLPDSFEIQVTTTWKSGVDDRAYGIALGSEPQNRYNFGVSGNGWSFVSGYKDNQVIDPAPMPWKSGTAIIGDGYKQNVLKIKAKGSTYDFFVNNLFVGTVTIPLSHDRLKVGFFVENKQQVTFDDLKITGQSASGNVIFSDSFYGNENSWPLWPNGEHYVNSISGGVYSLETKNNLNSAEFPAKFVQLPDNFDIEVTTTWKRGIDNYAYGLTLGTDTQNRFNFGLSGNGWSYVSGYNNNQVIDPMPMDWKSGTCLIGNGSTQNVVLVKVRGTRFEYYVNKMYVGEVNITLPRDRMRFGFFVENMQQVHFDNLKVTAY